MCILNFLKIIWLKHFVIALPANHLPQPHLTYLRKQTWRALVVHLDFLSPGFTAHQLKCPPSGLPSLHCPHPQTLSGFSARRCLSPLNHSLIALISF